MIYLQILYLTKAQNANKSIEFNFNYQTLLSNFIHLKNSLIETIFIFNKVTIQIYILGILYLNATMSIIRSSKCLNNILNSGAYLIAK